MGTKERWRGKNRRSSEDRRKFDDPNYKGPERRSGEDRRYREKPSLLVVDSSSTYLFYMGMLLKKLEYDVRTATTAEDALKILADSSPSLVITDTALPRMSGIVLLKQMKQDPRLKAIPVIIHTSDSSPVVKTNCRTEGCAGFFIKPVEPDALYRAIQAATESTPRQSIRIETSLRVEVGDAAAPAGDAGTGRVTTLSEGGLYIKTPFPGLAHAVIPLKLFMPNREIRVTATVLYSSPKIEGEDKEAGMAMQFVSIDPEDKAFIREFIKQQIMQGNSLALFHRDAPTCRRDSESFLVTAPASRPETIMPLLYAPSDLIST